MTEFVYRNGSRLTPYMLYQIERLNADFKAEFGVEIIVSSGIRIAQEQINIFLSRYVTAAYIRGRKVYDTRVWNGVRYYRISSAGTVAVPGTSNHEVQGTSGAVDLRDTGNDAGVATWGSRRSNWLRANCGKYGMVAEGFNFNEAWHYKMLNIFSAVPSSGGSSGAIIPKGLQVIYYHTEDATARKNGRVLAPANGFFLNAVNGAPVHNATNIVGGIGDYSLVLHVYASGAPGDAVDVQMFWDDTRDSLPGSPHYAQRFVIGESGILWDQVPFLRPVTLGYAVYAKLTTPSTNKELVKVSMFDADALLIK